MPELKRTFTGGKMNKDLDERIVPNGEYREALNISVATSEDSDVGAAQNILGNIRVTSAISSLGFNESQRFFGDEHKGHNKHIAEIVDPQTDMLYRFVHTTNSDRGIWMDRIVEYDTSKPIKTRWEDKENAVMVDIFKVTAKIEEWDHGCTGNNKCRIKVNRNLWQLRWGMTIVGPRIPEGVTIEHIDYDPTGNNGQGNPNSGWITLSEPIWCTYYQPPLAPFCSRPSDTYGYYEFIGDRNLNFDPERKITGINIIDGMLFWTDNYSEPKKVNIERGKLGSKSNNWDFSSISGVLSSGNRGQKKIDDFNQHTLLVVNDEMVTDCLKDESFCPPLGCTDELALNYNPLVIIDDGSCCYISGCTNPDSCNYNPDACEDDGSCCGDDDKDCGCGDPLYCEYDPDVCHDPSYCLTLATCDDPAAANYDPNSQCPGDCEYEYDCIDMGYYNDQCQHMLTIAELNYSELWDYNAEYYDPNDASTHIPQITSLGNQYGWGGFILGTPPPSMTVKYTIPDSGPYQNMGTNPALHTNIQVGAGAWMYQQNPNEEIGHYSHWIETDAWAFTQALTTIAGSGGCVLPLNPACNDFSDPECQDGVKWKDKIDAIILPRQWDWVDDKSWNEWNCTPKAGGQQVGGTPPSQNPTPPEGWWPTGGAGPPVYYVDVNGNQRGSAEMWSAAVCFGSGCADYTDPASNLYNPSITYWGGDKINYETGLKYGDTWAGIIEFLRHNGFGGLQWNGYGTATNAWGFRNNYIPPGINNQSYLAPQGNILFEERHGLEEYLGTVTVEDYITSGTPGNGTNPSYNPPGLFNPNGNIYYNTNITDPLTGNDTGYPKNNYGAYQEVTINDTVEEVIAKVTNNGMGWTYKGGGDIGATNEFHFIRRQCNCSQWSFDPQCIPWPGGPYASEFDCQACATCDCGGGIVQARMADPSLDNQVDTSSRLGGESLNSYSSSPLKYNSSSQTSFARLVDESDDDPRGGISASCPTFPEICRPVFVLEKHMSVIRKGPTQPPKLQMYKYEEETALVSSPDAGGLGSAASGAEGFVKTSFTGVKMPQSFNFVSNAGWTYSGPYDPNSPDSDQYGTGVVNPNTNRSPDLSIFWNPDGSHKKHGDIIDIPIDLSIEELDWAVNDQLLIEHTFTDPLGGAKKAVVRVSINSVNNQYGVVTSASVTGSYNFGQGGKYIKAMVMTTTGNFPKKAITQEDVYDISLVQNPALFKHKFPRFAYRYKYEDGEYSVFSPWSEIAFIPESFDYLPKKGYNLGMENAMRSLRIMNFVPKDIPKDVIQVDLLYKESNAPGVYTVASFKEDDPPEVTGNDNYWNSPGIGDNKGSYKIKSELIHKVVPSNQMLRPWDNVPKKALAQEITANRLVYANYTQNYNMKYYDFDTGDYNEVIPKFSVNTAITDWSVDGSNPKPGEPAKSLKSMRTYQLGIVYRDRYGRETPVLTDKSGSFKLDKSYAKYQNRLKVKMESPPPYWAESYTFYIKETANEYYNLSQDRWYDAEDGGIWLSFPSSERNKISDRTTLILKKQHDSFVFTGDKMTLLLL
jgi:hypothetical protein